MTLVRELPKNSHEIVRAPINEFKGKTSADL